LGGHGVVHFGAVGLGCGDLHAAVHIGLG
jgi:hypothetical protein